ncbi:MAG TPA: serine/threonine-protein kinase [Actinomycetota bacterium]|nr:serine/threonine-protein kinase [Actinomycetota bacterium]
MATVTSGLRHHWGLEVGDEIAPGLLAQELLGGGSRYEAYLAFDQRLHHLVVAKVLRPDRVDDESAIRGLRSEAEVLAAVNHPAVARMLRSGVDEERPHLVLELVEGPRLSTLIRRFGPVESVQAAPLAIEVASALHYLHGAGLVHLDVKPKNLIMGAPPRLIDLSIARSIESAARLDVPIGTDAYMAPEQCAPSPGRVGPPADVWGLGVTVYEALAGRPAFRAGDPEDPSPEARFPQLVEGMEPLPEHVPGELKTAVEASLAFEPADRPAAAEVADLVEPLLRHPRRMVLNQLKPRTRRE